MVAMNGDKKGAAIVEKYAIEESGVSKSSRHCAKRRAGLHLELTINSFETTDLGCSSKSGHSVVKWREN